MDSLKWIVGAIATLGVTVVSVLLGNTLLPARTIAVGKGLAVPWVFTWGLIWETVLFGVIIAGFMFIMGFKGGTHH
jgi:hypothetical protein